MKSKICFVLFFVYLFSLNGSYLMSDSINSKNTVSKRDIDEFVANISKDERNKNLLQALIQNQIISALDQSQTNTQSQKRIFKKRYLLSLLGLLGFSGINFGFFYKLFTGMKDKKTKIQNLQTVQEQHTETLAAYAKVLEELKVLCKQEQEKVEKRLVDKIEGVETTSAQEVNERLTKILSDMKESDTNLKQQLSDLEKNLGCKVEQALKDSESKNKEKQAEWESKINTIVQEVKQMAKDDKENQATLEKKLKDALGEGAKANDDLKKNLNKDAEDIKRSLNKDAQENYEKLISKFKEHVEIVDKKIGTEMEAKVKEYVCLMKEKKGGFWQNLFNLNEFGGISGFINTLAEGTKVVTNVTAFVKSLSDLSNAVLSDEAASDKNAREDADLDRRLNRLRESLKITPESLGLPDVPYGRITT